jgi:hypothetical protein
MPNEPVEAKLFAEAVQIEAKFLASAEQETAALTRAIRRRGKRWGRWTFIEGDRPFLMLAGRYTIDLNDIHGLADFGDWLIHLSEKRWVTADDLGNLVLAIGDLVRVGLMRDLRQRAAT